MSRLVEYDPFFCDLGDTVSFLHNGERLTGKVVLFYNTRLFYHVEVDGRRHEVNVSADDPRVE